MIEFFSSIESTSEASMYRKLLTKDPIVCGTIKNPNGWWTESSKETIDLLMEMHFLGCTRKAIGRSKIAKRERAKSFPFKTGEILRIKNFPGKER